MQLISVKFSEVVTTDINLDLNETEVNKIFTEQEIVVEYQNNIYQRFSKFSYNSEYYHTWLIEVEKFNSEHELIGKRFESWKYAKLSEVKDKEYIIGEPKGNGQCSVNLIHPKTEIELEKLYQEKINDVIKKYF